MKRLLLLFVFVGISVGMARADDIDIQIHGTTDSTISLASILNQWGTPGATSNTFTLPGTGTNLINGLNLVNDTGVTITSLEVYAYGVVGTGSSFSPSCGDPAPTLFGACVAPGAQSAGQLSAPIEWSFTGGSIGVGSTLRIVDQNTEPTGTDLYYEITINGAAYSGVPPGDPAPTPETSTLLLLGAGLLSLAVIGVGKSVRSHGVVAA